MVLGRMVYNFTTGAKILGVKAWRFGLYFVLLDIVFVLQISLSSYALICSRAFLVQAAGASMATGNNISNTQIENGKIMNNPYNLHS